jgi:hypothetical protein
MYRNVLGEEWNGIDVVVDVVDVVDVVEVLLCVL